MKNQIERDEAISYVENSIYQNIDSMLLGDFAGLQEFIPSTPSCPNASFLIKLAQIPLESMVRIGYQTLER